MIALEYIIRKVSGNVRKRANTYPRYIISKGAEVDRLGNNIITGREKDCPARISSGAVPVISSHDCSPVYGLSIYVRDEWVIHLRGSKRGVARVE